MNVIYRITPDLQKKFKTPIGSLFKGQFNRVVEIVSYEIRKNEKAKIIAVGDAVSENFMTNKFYPHILIIDNKIMRKKIKPIKILADKSIKTRGDRDG